MLLNEETRFKTNFISSIFTVTSFEFMFFVKLERGEARNVCFKLCNINLLILENEV